MIKRDISQLAVYRIAKEEETLALDCLRNLYLEYEAEIIYITNDNKLYGIICLGDILHQTRNGRVRINKKFTVLTGYNIIKAHDIFRTRKNIHKIPVVNEEKELLGDYSRWDDMLFIRRNRKFLLCGEAVAKVLKPYERVYVVEPVDNRNADYLYLLGQLKQWYAAYTVLKMSQIKDRLAAKSIFIFLNEDEKRAMQCLYGIESVSIRGWVKAVSYKQFLNLLIRELQFGRMGIEACPERPYEAIDDKEAALFSAFREKGLRCFNIYSDEYETTGYGKKFRNAVEKRLKAEPLITEEPWPKKTGREAFYGGLLENEDYADDTAQREIYQSCSVLELRKNITGKYFNAENGRRVTCCQPKDYTGTIYILGPCTILGVFVEDRYTIPSLLQKIITEKGYPYRVENLGAVMRIDAEMDSRLQEIGEYCANDIIIAVSRKKDGVSDGISLEKIFEKNNIPDEWVTDEYLHCSHKANGLIADSILELIEPYLLKRKRNTEGGGAVKVDLDDAMKAYIQRKYLAQYFSDFCGEKYGTVGAIVMNCNPFSKGHRYLIEQARKQVDFLIIFVVEENRSLFPFEERFKMVEEGTKDLDRIMVVPSGEFVLSYNNFREYFNKSNDEVTFLNAEYDIGIFARYIAKPLHITHRFAGEETEDMTTAVYNKAMKEILPREEIAFVEIPRITAGNEIISASRVRKYLEEQKYDKAFALLPETAKKHFMEQI